MAEIFLRPVFVDSDFSAETVERVADALHAEAMTEAEELRRLALYLTSATLRMYNVNRQDKYAPRDIFNALGACSQYAQAQLRSAHAGSN